MVYNLAIRAHPLSIADNSPSGVSLYRIFRPASLSFADKYVTQLSITGLGLFLQLIYGIRIFNYIIATYLWGLQF